MASAVNILRSSCRLHALQTLRCNKPWITASSLQHFAPPSFCVQKENSIYTTRNKLNVADHTGHNHSNIWTAERFLSAGLLGVLPVAFCYPNTVLDCAAALALTVHVHWGVEAIVVDYVRPNVVGTTLARVAVAAIYGLSFLMLGGLFYFNYNDVGLMNAVRMLWKL